MSERLFLQPPEIVAVDPSEPVVFLGGPMHAAPLWQYDARNIIHGIDKSIVVASPRRHYVERDFAPDLLAWEDFYLDRAGNGKGAIMFYLPPQTELGASTSYGQKTCIQLGIWFAKIVTRPNIRLVIGMPGGFGEEDYIKDRAAQCCPEAKRIVGENVLEETCKVAAQLAIAKAAGWHYHKK